MGLHICYELSLPGVTADEDAMQHLEALRAHALTLHVDDVTTVWRLVGRELVLDDSWSDRAAPRHFRIVAKFAREERDGVEGPVDEAQRLAAAGFFMNPGKGSETAIFGLVRPRLSPVSPSAERADEQDNWFWHHCCKTQYASTVSDEHLVHCHLAVVSMLEEAERLGFHVTVHDETHYWTTRSTERLIAEVHNMNRIVARFAGAFHDATSGQVRTEGAIFEHPDFERLETEPLDEPPT
jgi:hypothetical protein